MNDIKDVKPPVGLFDPWPLLVLLIVLIAAAVCVYLFLRFKKAPSKPAEPLLPLLPSWEIAYQQLEALRRDNLPDKGLFKEFFTRVADITRRCMENRFDIHAPHMTTEEFLYSLGVIGHLNESQKAALKDFLASCDMVKFAKYAPTINEALKNFDCAQKLIGETKPNAIKGSGIIDARI